MAPGLIRALAKIAADAPLVTTLLGRVVTHQSTSCCLSAGSARLIAFLALHPGPHDRHVIAGMLWPDASEPRAVGKLRSALWRLNALPVPLVDVDRSSVALEPQVLVDVRLLSDWAARVISGNHCTDDFAHTPWDLIGLDLLPGWPDDWLLLERERIRQRLMHGLENMACELIRSAAPPRPSRSPWSSAAPTGFARVLSASSSRHTSPRATGPRLGAAITSIASWWRGSSALPPRPHWLR